MKSSLAADGKRQTVYPADVRGPFARARIAVFALLIAVYASLPWVPVGGHPAVFIDVERREFYLFGAVFNAQDLWLTVFLFTGAAFALVVVTSVLGRVWCGWACPQTVFLEGLYRRIERFVEGSREARMRRHARPWTWDKVWRKAVVHAWVALSLLLAHVLLAYFVSVPAVLRLVRARPGENWDLFALVMGVSGVLYFNFAWFREQFCVVLCPYGRLQSVLLDPNSLVVGYDQRRGEPRGKAKAEGRGDCVDCNRCVVVCPTGIDIRNGLQMDCLACTACIDACDTVMLRLGRQKGLIRYDSQAAFVGTRRRWLTPRMGGYALLGLAGVVAATFALGGRHSFDANVLRAADAPYVTEGDVIRNLLHVHLVNKRSDTCQFEIHATGAPEAAFLIPLHEVTLSPLGTVDVPIFVTVPRHAYRGEFPVHVMVKPRDDTNGTDVQVRFMGPSS